MPGNVLLLSFIHSKALPISVCRQRFLGQTHSRATYTIHAHNDMRVYIRCVYVSIIIIYNVLCTCTGSARTITLPPLAPPPDLPDSSPPK